MSGVHFEIENFGERIELRDRNSTNKTFVNHSAQMKCNISPGDVIRAGKTVFSFQWETLQKSDDPQAIPKSIEKTFDSHDHGSFVVNSPFGPSLASAPQSEDLPKADLKDGQVVELPKLSGAPPSSSPFESLDASYLSKIKNQPTEPPASAADSNFGQREFGSPFDDSSIHSFPFAAPSKSPPIPNSCSARFIPTRLTQKPTASGRVDIDSIIDTLARRCDLRIVAHFRKIGLTTPPDLKMGSVFPFLEDGWQHLPVIVEAKEWQREELRKLTTKLANADGLLLVVTQGLTETVTALQGLCSFEVPGLSQNNGFLAWCWPSQFQNVVNILSDAELAEFFGDAVEAIVFPVTGTWVAYANPDLTPVFSELGFD